MSLEPPQFLAPLLDAPVAVFGGGLSGEGVCALVATLGGRAAVYDERGATFTAAAARGHRLAVFSPGFMPDHPWLGLARAGGTRCLGELDFASLFWTGQIVAITGTNGKTTLTEFVTHALQAAGREAHATGNIGRSFSALVAALGERPRSAVAVCEVSSFQAETLVHFHAISTLWTNFAEDHLERHDTLEAYFAAKWNLLAHTVAAKAGPPAASAARAAATGGAKQAAEAAEGGHGAVSREQGRAAGPETGSSLAPGALTPPPVLRATGAFVGASVRRWADKLERPLIAAVVIDTEAQPPDPALAGTVFAEYPQRENFILAQAWWRAAGLDEAALHAAARSFRLGRHRLTRVAEIDGVAFWNDSKATNFHAVEAALSRFPTPVVLIAGGKSKGGDLAGFVRRIAPRVHHVVLIGATSAELAAHCEAARVAHTRCGSLAEAVRRAAGLAPRGGQVLLSPAFASFDQFRNYEDRGEQFEKLVRELGAAAASLR